MSEISQRDYVTLMPATPRRGWLVANRDGDIITHKRLEKSAIHDPVSARAEAREMFPDKTVVMYGDTHPWDPTATDLNALIGVIYDDTAPVQARLAAGISALVGMAGRTGALPYDGDMRELRDVAGAIQGDIFMLLMTGLTAHDAPGGAS